MASIQTHAVLPHAHVTKCTGVVVPLIRCFTAQLVVRVHVMYCICTVYVLYMYCICTIYTLVHPIQADFVAVRLALLRNCAIAGWGSLSEHYLSLLVPCQLTTAY